MMKQYLFLTALVLTFFLILLGQVPYLCATEALDSNKSKKTEFNHSFETQSSLSALSVSQISKIQSDLEKDTINIPHLETFLKDIAYDKSTPINDTLQFLESYLKTISAIFKPHNISLTPFILKVGATAIMSGGPSGYDDMQKTLQSMVLEIKKVQKQLQELGLPIEGPTLEEGLSLNGESVTLHNLMLAKSVLGILKSDSPGFDPHNPSQFTFLDKMFSVCLVVKGIVNVEHIKEFLLEKQMTQQEVKKAFIQVNMLSAENKKFNIEDVIAKIKSS